MLLICAYVCVYVHIYICVNICVCRFVQRTIAHAHLLLSNIYLCKHIYVGMFVRYVHMYVPVCMYVCSQVIDAHSHGDVDNITICCDSLAFYA